MQYFTIIAASAALAAAQSTVPTGPPMGVYRTVVGAPAVTATTIMSVATATASVVAIQKRDDTICVPQPTGIAHNTVPDTAEAFLADAYYSSAALTASTPSTYKSVYINNNSSNNADQYMGYTLMDTYDVQACASKCDAFTGCNSFNVYFERDPIVDPNDATCLTPASTPHIKCVWWGSILTSATAVNDGQWRGGFHVVIAGSNAYNKLPVVASSSTTSSAAATSTTSSAAAASTTSSGFATSTVARVATTTSAAAAATSSVSTTTANTVNAFYIQIGYSGSSLDTKYMTVASSGTITYTTVKSSASTFVIDASGNLIVKATGIALNLTYNTGAWQKIYFNNKATNTKYTYATCALVSPYVQCEISGNFQFAGVCNNDGNLYFGLPSKMPSACRWAGLYPISA